ncbi:PREDICTED: uncharacterized protein LOC108545020 isoform X2 [Rhinopithecus bieti]|uniref:uncharacterized protein LOC108545020 isoform X2 n=1 Tax=Rhinopithecus bieti TaxID=61621 RepID=UPI00083BDB74|nr:PREDICTED: uncharacterized protein LOC108545020 isoform X2 [Rhinopithecus bieti]
MRGVTEQQDGWDVSQLCPWLYPLLAQWTVSGGIMQKEHRVPGSIIIQALQACSVYQRGIMDHIASGQESHFIVKEASPGHKPGRI